MNARLFGCPFLSLNYILTPEALFGGRILQVLRGDEALCVAAVYFMYLPRSAVPRFRSTESLGGYRIPMRNTSIKLGSCFCCKRFF